MYYLGERYYDPQVKRFINADHANLIAANTYGLTDKNLFSYCDNNPVVRQDDGGEFWNIVIGAVVGGGISAAITAVDSLIENKGDIDWNEVVHGAVSGAISGAVAASGVRIVGQRLVGAATSAMDAIYGGIRDVKSGECTVARAVINTVTSAGVGALTAGTGMNTSKMKGLRTAARSARSTLKKTGVHPVTKKAATRAVRSFSRYSKKQYLSFTGETALYSSFSWGVSKVVHYAYK